MPFGTIIQTRNDQQEVLYEQLRQEWARETTIESGPVIIETIGQGVPQSTPTHLYVIWDDWRDLSQRERSEMIMRVYEEVRGRQMALNVTFAMGLTREEATRMGIQYETPNVV